MTFTADWRTPALTLLNSTELKMSILSENSLCMLLSRLVSMGALQADRRENHSSESEIKNNDHILIIKVDNCLSCSGSERGNTDKLHVSGCLCLSHTAGLFEMNCASAGKQTSSSGQRRKTQFSNRLLSVADVTDALTSCQISFSVFRCYQTMF